MKTTNILKLLLVSFLLLIPTTISAASVSAANPVQLIPGQATFIGVVDVSNLQETGQSAIGQSVQGPRHSQGLQTFEQGTPPPRHDFYTRFLYYDLPVDVAKRLERFFYISDPTDLRVKHQEAVEWVRTLI